MRHRRWLTQVHHFCRQCKAFNGKIEDEGAPTTITGDAIWEMVKDVNVEFRKGSKMLNGNSKWIKQSFFFELPYLRYLYVCFTILV